MQTRKASILEAFLNVGSGFLVSYIILSAILPLYNVETSPTENAEIVAIFTVASIVRSYLWRRLFNRWSGRG